MKSWITEKPLKPWEFVADYEREVIARLPGKTGASAVFTGSMRDFNEPGALSGDDGEIPAKNTRGGWAAMVA